MLTLLFACSTVSVTGKEAPLDSALDSEAAPGDSAPPDSEAPPVVDSVVVDSAVDTSTGDSAAPPPEPQTCAEYLADQTGVSPDYAQFGPVLNDACQGTDHQDIAGIEQVVFVGDSITVGTPPNTVEGFYRNLLAADLATRYSLVAPEYEWQWYDVINGTGYTQDSGDFSVCAKWGGRTDDLVEDHAQVSDCIPESRAGETTLVFITVGGNDLFALVEDYHAGIPVGDLWLEVEAEVARIEEAVSWIKSDKTRFPGEMFVVFANIYEFTDGMGNVDACPGAESLGYVYDLSAPELVDMIRYYEEGYMRVAVETGSDMVFMSEGFCGHGYNAEDPTGPCYREDDRELWFDMTCFHPNDAGHTAIAEMFLSTVEQ